MSNKPRQLLALILALSLSFNLLIASAESAQMSADVSANVSAQTTEKKPEGEPKPETEPEPEPEPEEEPESVQKEDTEAEETQEEEHPEAEPEAEGEESEEEAEEEVESEEEAEEADEAETAPKEEQAQTKKQPGLVPGMSLTAQAETYSSYVWDELQEGDILKPGARVSGDNITVVLQANGWGSEDEVSAYDTSFTPANGLEVGENNGFIRDDEYNQRYPYANGEMVSAWVVVSYEGGEDSWDPKTITLTGYAPPPREPVTEIGSDTTLTQNINGYVTITGDVTLDLAGYTITGGGNYGTIYVNNGCTLTLKDSSAGKTGTITGGGGDTGGGVAVSENATFNMQGGTITGNSAAQGGGVYSSGTFNMSGGTISNNNATGGFEGVGGGVVIQSGNFTMSGTAAITGNSSGDYGNGGGVYFAGTTFTMSGGSITQNSGYYGAGVYMDSGTLNMSGNASISSNTASGCSGGVQVTDDATLNMSESAVIANNTAGYEGGAIYLDGTITMTGSASITGNSNSDKSAGGICVHNGTLKIGGGVKISGNTRNGSAEDVDLYPGKVITVTAALTEETPITVRRSDSNGRNYWEGVITANDGSSYTVQESDKAKFSPASSGQRVKWVDGQARLNNLYRVTYNANGATSGTVPADVNNPYESGSTVTVLGNTGELAKTGNTFNGWNTAANGSGTPYAAGATFGITGNTTLYAQWEEVPQTADVSITAGEGMTKTTDSGAAEQTGLSGAMTDVVYNADDGYYFPADYSVTPPVNGISVIRNGFTQITVSGTPTANAEITLTAATAKTTPDAPTTAAAENCTTADNNDGKLTGVTTAMEYKKSDAADWTAGTGSDITGLVPGTYYVRVKATETTNASTNQELTIKGFISYTVTFKVVNGKWSDNTTQDKTEIIASGSSLARVPTGMTADNGYTGGAWDTDPADAIITEATTFTYTFTAKQAATVTKAPEAKTLTYNSSAQELVTAGEATGGIMQYALGENATTAPADNLYTTSIPTATNAGIYYVWYRAKRDSDHLDSDAACVTAKIEKADLTPTVSIDDWVYGESASTPSVSGNSGNGQASYTYAKKGTTDFTPSVPSDTGEYTVKAVIAETANYKSGSATSDFKIKKADPDVTPPTANTLIYNGSEQELVTAGSSPNGEMQYSLSETGSYSTAIPTGTDAGEYSVWYKVVGDSNHSDTNSEKVDVTIEAKEVGLVWTNTNLTYNGQEQKPTAAATDLVDADKGKVSVTVTGAQTDASDTAYTVTAAALTGGRASNYKLPSANTSPFTIEAKEASLTWSDTSFTYDGESHKPSATVTGLVDGDTCTVIVTGAQTDAGEYTATASALSNSNYKLAGNNTRSFTIDKAKPTLSELSAADITYGQSLSASAVSGTATGVNEKPVAGTWAWSSGSTRPAVSDSNRTEFGVTFTSDNSNYDNATDKAVLTVKPREVGLVWANTNLTYNGQEQKPTAAATNLVDADKGKVSVTITGAQTDASDTAYTATASGLTGDQADNYTLPENRTNTFTIGKASPGTPHVSMQDYTYGRTLSTPGISDYAGGGAVTYYYSAGISHSGGTEWADSMTATSLDIGTWYLYAVIAPTKNYLGYTTQNTRFEVNQAFSTVSGSSSFGDFSGEVTLTLQACDSGELVASDRVRLNGGAGGYHFAHIPQGRYILTASWTEAEKENDIKQEVKIQ